MTRNNRTRMLVLIVGIVLALWGRPAAAEGDAGSIWGRTTSPTFSSWLP
jgi:hypothetical protein